MALFGANSHIYIYIYIYTGYDVLYVHTGYALLTGTKTGYMCAIH